MKIKKYIYIAAAAILSSCQSEEIIRYVYSVGEADNAIRLTAGIREGDAGVQTRAGVDGNHDGNTYGGKHSELDEGIKLALRVSGTWKENTVVKHTTATIGAEIKDAEDKGTEHNDVKFTTTGTTPEMLYWDDYGTADPENAAGRNTGLTIYAAAVNDKTVISAPTLSENNGSLNVLSWNVGEPSTGNLIDQSVTGTPWTKKDLITSNNITATGDGTLKFDDLKTGSTTTPSNILEFTHAMSRITVVLKAGKGFPGYSVDPATATFEQNPEVVLKGFNYTGSVNIVDKTSVPTADKTADINMYLTEGGKDKNTATFDAVVFPGNIFADATEILTLNADGNRFVVTAANLNAAINAAITADNGYPTDKGTALQQGWNYKLQITVNKTEIHVQATVMDWKHLTSAVVEPKITVVSNYGELSVTDGPFEKDFDFLLSEKLAEDYQKEAWIAHAESDGNHTYTMHDQLYWPNHDQHYFFRGLWPRIGTSDQTDVNKAYTIFANVSDKDVEIKNVSYTTGTYPSDLMLGIPYSTNEKCQHEKVVATYGICATEGNIILNFRYMMSQVKVVLTTTDAGQPDHVVIDANTKVEILNPYTGGKILLKDGSVDLTGQTVLEKYQMSATSSVGTYHDAIVPQALSNGTGDAAKDLIFRITIKNGTDPETTDVYECVIKDIDVKEGTAGTLGKISKWEAGKTYTYNLKIRKTAITVTATMTDWETVNASQEVWF